ncbi:hypothetical protein JF541_19045 [Marinobacter hydrocarbonoclasticus]|uniref:hypothetical protein n=1 Tax=Marinobacter nauticus TaxID=2743 RepID=UPI001A90ACD5|nr:hypothetical protein [Marinobacter nauticus]MBN8241257.1 hypothetical protein [Marinobacter nauticus]
MSSNVIPIRPNQIVKNDVVHNTPAAQDVRKLARALFISLNIAPGDSLVCLLGSGDETSNFEAVVSWVKDTLIREKLTPDRLALQVLLPALEKRLFCVTDKMPHF